MVMQQQAVRPQQYAVTPTQIDFSQIISMIVPIMGLALVFGMLMPMMRSMSEGFK